MINVPADSFTLRKDYEFEKLGVATVKPCKTSIEITAEPATLVN